MFIYNSPRPLLYPLVMSEIESIGEQPGFVRAEWAADDDSSVCSRAKHGEKHAASYRGTNSVVRYSAYAKRAVRVQIYETVNAAGHLIRNAMSGAFTHHRVGTADEDLYFSAILATGECSKGPVLVFYETPEQQERHMHLTVSDEIKDKWRQKYNAALRTRQDQLIASSKNAAARGVSIH